ncbi:MAG: exonuclease SbcCD subunit D [Acidimicrobiales bacterium]
MKILHTSDWHVGRTIRGRSRSDEHEAVLAEIAGIARAQAVDLVLVVGDVFDTAAPTAEAERVAYAGLLDLASVGVPVIVVSGNHDNERRLQAVAPMLDLGHIVTRASFLPASEGGVVTGTTAGGERWRVACIPFLSQRWVVHADDLLDPLADSGAHRGQYAARVARLVGALTADFMPDAVNIVAAHLHVDGGLLGGGERPAHTIFDYAVSPAAFPSSVHYVALGHLHRAQRVPGPAPTRYCGSPLQLDFGETNDTKSVTLVTASAGLPAAAEEIALTAGRGLRTIAGSLAELHDIAAAAATRDEWLRVVVREPARLGLGDEVRDLFPDAVEVVVDAPGRDAVHPDRPARAGRGPGDLFREYLAQQGVSDDRLLAMFDRLLDEQVLTPSDVG